MDFTDREKPKTEMWEKVLKELIGIRVDGVCRAGMDIAHVGNSQIFLFKTKYKCSVIRSKDCHTSDVNFFIMHSKVMDIDSFI